MKYKKDMISEIRAALPSGNYFIKYDCNEIEIKEIISVSGTAEKPIIEYKELSTLQKDSIKSIITEKGFKEVA